MLRRDSLKYLFSGACIAFSALIKPISVLAKWNEAAFTAVDYDEAISAYFPGQELQESDLISIGVHSIVENGAVVPVKIKSDLPNIESISIFVDKNPNPLIANFDLAPGCLGFVATRIKVQQDSNIIAVVKSNGTVFSKSTFIEVQEGGCG